MTEAELVELLAFRYQTPEWAFFDHLAGGTRSIADGLAVNLWTTRGQEILGFEIKCARGDWLGELKNPRKQEEGVFRYCDRFFLVAPKEIVKKEEVPPAWGWLAPYGEKLRSLQPAMKQNPLDIDRMFMTRLLVRALKLEQSRGFADHERLKGSADYKRGVEDGRRREESLSTTNREYTERLERRVREFEQSSGISITGYHEDVPKIGKLVAFLLNDRNRLQATHHLDVGLGQLRQFDMQLTAIIKGVKEFEGSLGAVEKVPA